MLFAVLGILGAGAIIIVLPLFIIAMTTGAAVYGTTIWQGERQMTGDASPATDPPPYGW